VISGPHKGKQGEVTEVIRKKNSVVIDGLNMVILAYIFNSIINFNSCFCVCQHHRWVKANPGVAPGRVYLAPGPIHYSNINLIDPSVGYVKLYLNYIYFNMLIAIFYTTRKPTRVGIRFSEEGEKLRVSKKTGTIIPKPEILKERHQPRAKGIS